MASVGSRPRADLGKFSLIRIKFCFYSGWIADYYVASAAEQIIPTFKQRLGWNSAL